MSGRQIHPKRPVFSASNVREALAQALTEIKNEDGLTDADLGAVLGKSPDRAREYRLATATMDAETYGRGKREWNGRFTGYFERLCVDSRPSSAVSDHEALTACLKGGVMLAEALEDGEITPEEVRAHRRELEDLRDAIEAQLCKLRPAA
jgi:hypothetical protein